MDQDRPLHVQVAEALGWTKCDAEAESERWEFHDDPPAVRVGLGVPPGADRREEIYHYDTDWSATGPLIEKHTISVYDDDGWMACTDFCEVTGVGARGTTPLIAVCNLILELSKAGKL